MGARLISPVAESMVKSPMPITEAIFRTLTRVAMVAKVQKRLKKTTEIRREVETKEGGKTRTAATSMMMILPESQ